MDDEEQDRGYVLVVMEAATEELKANLQFETGGLWSQQHIQN
jgi:hypothetical protein